MRRVSCVPLVFFYGGLVASAQQDQPFTNSERWAHYLHRTYSPARWGFLLADTAFDHALRDPKCWDSSASSYALRLSRAAERRVIRNTAELAAGIWTGEDLRYRPSQSTQMSGRVWNAMRGAVTARMPDGSRRPAYTRFLASAVAEVSTAHWTNHAVQPSWLLQSVAGSVLGQLETNLLDEFSPTLRQIGMRLWRRTPFSPLLSGKSGSRKLASAP